jgi:hypothetical protein
MSYSRSRPIQDCSRTATWWYAPRSTRPSSLAPCAALPEQRFHSSPSEGLVASFSVGEQWSIMKSTLRRRPRAAQRVSRTILPVEYALVRAPLWSFEPCSHILACAKWHCSLPDGRFNGRYRWRPWIPQLSRGSAGPEGPRRSFSFPQLAPPPRPAKPFRETVSSSRCRTPGRPA